MTFLTFFVFKLCLDNELSNIRTFCSITMLMLCLIHVKPICEKNIISNTFNPSFKGQNWRKIKNVTCGTFFSCFQIFLNNELSNIRTFYWFTFLMPCFIHKKQIFEKKSISNTLNLVICTVTYRHVWDNINRHFNFKGPK